MSSFKLKEGNLQLPFLLFFSPFIYLFFKSKNFVVKNQYNPNFLHFFRSQKVGTHMNFAGVLVCFGRSPYARRTSVKPEGATPRALSALGASVRSGGNFMQIYPNSYVQSTDNISISSFYFQDRVNKFKFT